MTSDGLLVMGRAGGLIACVVNESGKLRNTESEKRSLSVAVQDKRILTPAGYSFSTGIGQIRPWSVMTNLPYHGNDQIHQDLSMSFSRVLRSPSTEAYSTPYSNWYSH